MENLIDFGTFWFDYGSVILTSAFWLVVFLIIGKSILAKNLRLQAEVEDLVASNRWNIELVTEAEQDKKMSHDAWLASANENLRLRRENHLLKEKIQKKQEFRLRDGRWCTEEQYIAERDWLTLGEQLDAVKKTQEAIASVDINEECNKQIEEFLKK